MYLVVSKMSDDLTRTGVKYFRQLTSKVRPLFSNVWHTKTTPQANLGWNANELIASYALLRLIKIHCGVDLIEAFVLAV